MSNDFTEGSIAKKLIFFALPIVAGMMMHTAYNIIDTIFIGMLGPNELAAISLAFPVIFVFIAVASGLGIGANALISQAIGKKNRHEANNYSEHALFLGTIIGIVIAVAGIIFSPALFTMMGADETVLPLAIEYSVPIFFGLIFMFIWFVSDSILKAQGDSKTPMKSMVISLVINIILDPILIFGLGPFPQLGLFGAALATVFARIIAAALNFYYIYSPKSVVNLSLRDFKPDPGCIKRMLDVGVPASAGQTLSAAGFMLLMGIVGSFGSFAIAAFGVGLRINSVAIMPLIGLSSAVASFVGQNIGARNFDRAKKVALFASKISFVISAFFAAVVFFFPEAIMSAFSSDPNVIAIGSSYLLVIPGAFLFYGLYFPIIGSFQGAGKTKLALVANAAYWFIAVVLAYLLALIYDLNGVWFAMVIAGAVELVLVAAIFFSGYWLKKL